MPSTFNHLPINIPTIFKSIVATVSANLADDTTWDIPFVSCKVETWNELCNRLKADGEVSETKSLKYPLIALIRNFDEVIRSDDPFVTTSINVVIVTLSDPTWLSEKREQVNYFPTLYPIYAELMSVIASSEYFVSYYNPYPSHTKQDNLHLGRSGANGNTDYLLPDCVDAVTVTNLQLRLDVEKCLKATIGPTLQVAYLNNVKTLVCTILNNTLSVLFSDHEYIDINNIGTPRYYLYFSHRASDAPVIEIDPLDNYTMTFVDGESGDYYGYISCDDGVTISKLYFYYTCDSGVVIRYSNLNKFILENFKLGGHDNPIYPMDIVTHTITNKPVISSREIVADGGTVVWSQTIDTPINDTTELTQTQSFTRNTSIRDVGCNVNIDSSYARNILLESISYYQLL